MEIALDRESPTPLYLQIAHGLREQILAGILPAGGKLPPSRRLAERLGVNRSTVVQAYGLLWSEGLLDGHVGSGTVVRAHASAEPLPISPPPWNMLFTTQAEAVEDELRDLLRVFAQEDLISLAAGLPPADLYPMDELRALSDEILARDGRAHMQWCAVEGYAPLRRLLAERLPGLTAAEILITAGSTQGLYLLARSMLSPGDAVVVESPTYLGALKVFQATGARVIGVPVDEGGINIDMLAGVLERVQPKLLYVLPTFQNPTGAIMPLDRRKALLELAYRHRLPIVEDDPYSLLAYEGTVPPPLKALDVHGHVIYLSTFTKILAPGLRIGWIAAPKPVIERLTPAKYLLDLFTNSVAQAVVCELTRRGILDAHLVRMRAEYRRRRDALCAGLRAHCSRLEFSEPAGGYFVWCRLPAGVSAKELLREALREGVSFLSGDIFYPDGRGQDRIRLSFPGQSPEAIEEGMRRLGRALRHLQRRRGQSAQEHEAVIRPIV
jgi:DNA-binding transcriptional MocR family regulator